MWFEKWGAKVLIIKCISCKITDFKQKVSLTLVILAWIKLVILNILFCISRVENSTKHNPNCTSKY